MKTELNNLEKNVNSGLTTKIKSSEIKFNYLAIETEIEEIVKVILFLKTNEKCKFRQLTDITAVDYPRKEKRFKLVYLLLSHENNHRLIINSNIKEKTIVPSITKIFPSANWMEREVFDMYGITFKDHPDLRRILTDYGFEGHPLRKDFPLTGYKEVRYSEDQKKVIYESVKLEQNYRNFDFESPWQGTKYIKDQIKDKK
jgi:NADH-quinone oxidoreductase subunit C